MTAGSNDASTPNRLGRVVFVCDLFHPSTESTSTLFTQLLTAIRPACESLDVITQRLPSRGSDSHTTAAAPAGIRIIRVGMPVAWRTGIVARLCKQLAFAIEATFRLVGRNYDRCIGGTNPSFTPVWLWATSFITRRPYSVIVHDVYPDGLVAVGLLSNDSLITAGWRKLNRLAYRRAEKVFVLGHDMADLMAKHYGVAPERLVFMPNWSSFDQPRPRPFSESRLAEELNLGQHIVVQYSGNMGLWHDIEAIVRAAEILRDDPRIRFLFIGGGRRRSQAQRLSDELGLSNVHWLDFQPAAVLPDSLACCHIAMISQRPGLEGVAVPCKLYGILASGRPIVAAVPPECEVGRVIATEGCGILAGPSNAAEIAAAIRCLANDAGERAAMGEKAFAAYRRHYSLAHAANRFLQAFD
jgi:glycosyltransferase involved in cell wall biosynthesis